VCFVCVCVYVCVCALILCCFQLRGLVLTFSMNMFSASLRQSISCYFNTCTVHLFLFSYNQPKHNSYHKTVHHNSVWLYDPRVKRHCCDVQFCYINCTFVGCNKNENKYHFVHQDSYYLTTKHVISQTITV